jgi:hypothetical protein
MWKHIRQKPEPLEDWEVAHRKILEISGLKRTRAPWTISPRYPYPYEREAFPVIGYGLVIVLVAVAVLIRWLDLPFFKQGPDLSPSEICAEEAHNGKHLTMDECLDIWIAQHTPEDR